MYLLIFTIRYVRNNQGDTGTHSALRAESSNFCLPGKSFDMIHSLTKDIDRLLDFESGRLRLKELFDLATMSS